MGLKDKFTFIEKNWNLCMWRFYQKCSWEIFILGGKGQGIYFKSICAKTNIFSFRFSVDILKYADIFVQTHKPTDLPHLYAMQHAMLLVTAHFFFCWYRGMLYRPHSHTLLWNNLFCFYSQAAMSITCLWDWLQETPGLCDMHSYSMSLLAICHLS